MGSTKISVKTNGKRWFVTLEETTAERYHRGDDSVEWTYSAKLTKFDGMAGEVASKWLEWNQPYTKDESPAMTGRLFIAAWISRSPDYSE